MNIQLQMKMYFQTSEDIPEVMILQVLQNVNKSFNGYKSTKVNIKSKIYKYDIIFNQIKNRETRNIESYISEDKKQDLNMIRWSQNDISLVYTIFIIRNDLNLVWFIHPTPKFLTYFIF